MQKEGKQKFLHVTISMQHSFPCCFGSLVVIPDVQQYPTGEGNECGTEVI